MTLSKTPTSSLLTPNSCLLYTSSICLDQTGQLEQLETLYRAGLYTTEEYRKKKEEILRGK